MNEIKKFNGIYFQVNLAVKSDAIYKAESVVNEVLNNGKKSVSQWTVSLQTEAYNLFYFLAVPVNKGLSIPQIWDTVYLLKEQPKLECVNPDFEYEQFKDGGPVGCDVPHPLHAAKPNWHLDNMHAWEAFALKDGVSNKGKGVRVGLIDTGYRSHPDTFGSGRMLYRMGANVWNSTWDAWSDPMETGSGMHSTGTASLIIGPEKKRTNILTGSAPDAEIIPIRASMFVLVPPINLIKAIDHAIRTNCHVISMSIGWLPFGAGVDMAEKYLQYAATQKGIIPIAAAAQPGLLNAVGGTFPGVSAWTITVGAHNVDGVGWDKQVRGDHVDVSAPGTSVCNGDYKVIDPAKKPVPENYAQYASKAIHQIKYGCGTSFATALTAGAAATWLSYRGINKLKDTYGPNLFRVFMYELFKYGLDTKDWPKDKGYGKGRINMLKLMTRDNNPAPTVKEVDSFFAEEQVRSNLYIKAAQRLGRMTVAEALKAIHLLLPDLTYLIGDYQVYKMLEVYETEILLQLDTNQAFRSAFYEMGTNPNTANRAAAVASLNGIVSDSLARQIGLNQ